MKNLCKILMLLVVIIFLQNAEGRKLKVTGNSLSQKPKGTLKTIMTEDGDVIDCVDIYNQPSFDHPLLKNHTIQMRPSSYPIGLLERPNDTSVTISQTWSANEECPEGTVRILRAYKDKSTSAVSPTSLSFTQLNGANGQASNHRFAMAYQRTQQQERFAIAATVNVWNPNTEPGDYSSAQLWLGYEGSPQYQEIIVAGWQVYPQHYNDYKTRVFISYTNNGYRTYCYNLDCPGFIMVNPFITLGQVIPAVSSRGGEQIAMDVVLYVDSKTKNLWYFLEKKPVGYWPGSLFQHLINGANMIAWGGEVASTSHPTATTMGSGSFPEEGFRGASYMRNMMYLDKDQHSVIPDEKSISYSSTEYTSYHTTPLETEEEEGNKVGALFYFGGPGVPKED